MNFKKTAALLLFKLQLTWLNALTEALCEDFVQSITDKCFQLAND